MTDRSSDNLLTDKAIRTAFVKKLRGDDPNGVVFHELPIARGKRRADLAFVNGSLAGFEIKSSHDKLVRISGQAAAYEQIFERMTAVVAPRHLASLGSHLPENWEIIVAERRSGALVFRQIRKGRWNRNQQNAVLVRLLWKNECIRILRSHGAAVKKSDLIIDLWNELEKLPTSLLCREIKTALKTRRG